MRYGVQEIYFGVEEIFENLNFENLKTSNLKFSIIFAKN